ncbi:MAG: hypothetical protein ACRD2R_01795, partial [Terriglobales bacterium]
MALLGLLLIPLTGCIRLRTGDTPVPPSLPLTMNVFYATDRQPEPFDPKKCNPVSDGDRFRTFGRNAAGKLSFGTFPVVLRESHRTGKLAEPLPRSLDCRQPRRKPLMASRPSPLAEEEFFRALQ